MLSFLKLSAFVEVAGEGVLVKPLECQSGNYWK